MTNPPLIALIVFGGMCNSGWQYGKVRLKHLYSYQRLESSKKANPELKTLIGKIKEAFPDFDLNMII